MKEKDLRKKIREVVNSGNDSKRIAVRLVKRVRARTKMALR